MAKSFIVKIVLILFVTGCVILFSSVPVKASSLTFIDNTFISYEVPEGENVTIDCSTVQPAYYTALSFHHSPVPPFYLAPDGKKFIQEGQVFTITNVTHNDNGKYACLVKDKDLQSTVLQVAEIVIITPKPSAVDPSQPNALPSQEKQAVEETAAKKLAESKPYLYFKEKSPLRMHVKDTTPIDLSLSVKGLQPIKIQWKKDERELMIGSRYKTFDSDRRLLVDPPFTVEDSGTYSASACNSKGCAVRGVQVLFQVTPNITQIVRQTGEELESTQGEGFVGNWIKKYGFLGIPTGLAIILIIAIACVAGDADKEKAAKGKKIEEFTEDLHMQKEREGGRTASLWSWQSDGESSPDEMPDYDKLKTPKKRSQRQEDSPEAEYDESNYPELHYGDSHYHLAEHTEQRHYSNEGINYNNSEHSNDQDHYNTTPERKRQQQGGFSNDEDIYTTVDIRKYSGSQGDSSNDRSRKGTSDGGNTHHDPQLHNKGYDLTSANSTQEDADKIVYATYTGHVQSGIKPMRAQVLENREHEPQAARAYTHTVDIHEEDDEDEDCVFYDFD